jgi:hypothetical protein
MPALKNEGWVPAKPLEHLTTRVVEGKPQGKSPRAAHTKRERSLGYKTALRQGLKPRCGAG